MKKKLTFLLRRLLWIACLGFLANWAASLIVRYEELRPPQFDIELLRNLEDARWTCTVFHLFLALLGSATFPWKDNTLFPVPESEYNESKGKKARRVIRVALIQFFLHLILLSVVTLFLDMKSDQTYYWREFDFYRWSQYVNYLKLCLGFGLVGFATVIVVSIKLEKWLSRKRPNSKKKAKKSMSLSRKNPNSKKKAKKSMSTDQNRDPIPVYYKEMLTRCGLTNVAVDSSFKLQTEQLRSAGLLESRGLFRIRSGPATQGTFNGRNLQTAKIRISRFFHTDSICEGTFLTLQSPQDFDFRLCIFSPELMTDLTRNGFQSEKKRTNDRLLPVILPDNDLPVNDCLIFSDNPEKALDFLQNDAFGDRLETYLRQRPQEPFFIGIQNRKINFFDAKRDPIPEDGIDETLFAPEFAPAQTSSFLPFLVQPPQISSDFDSARMASIKDKIINDCANEVHRELDSLILLASDDDRDTILFSSMDSEEVDIALKAYLTEYARKNKPKRTHLKAKQQDPTKRGNASRKGGKRIP